MMSRVLIPASVVLAVLSSCSGTPAPSGDGAPLAITVTEKGFEPAVVTVKAGSPVTLVVTRTTERTCATEFVLKEKNINQPLPLNQPVTITFTPDHAGDLGYACAMDMYRGTVRVQ